MILEVFSFNPCCDGLYKRTSPGAGFTGSSYTVSILVVMDYIKERIYISTCRE